MLDYRLVAVDPRSKAVFGSNTGESCRLPRVRISGNKRQVHQVVAAAETQWGLKVLILDFLSESDSVAPFVVAIVLDFATKGTDFFSVPLQEIPSIELTEKERDLLNSTICGRGPNLLSHIRWFDEAIAWVEEVTGKRISSEVGLEQLNAGGGYALIRFETEDLDHYWLKATGGRNQHEMPVTCLLSDLFPAALPPIIACKEEWNAWLMEEAGSHFPAAPAVDEVSCAAEGFANLQIQMRERTDSLLAAGAFDQRIPTLINAVEPVTDYLIEAMERQESMRAPVLHRDCLLELADTLRRACLALETLGIPDTLIHNDLSRYNILLHQGNCVFIDWSEASIGNPFLGCERLCRLSRAHQGVVHLTYRRFWAGMAAPASVEKAIVLAPLLAIYAYLYGRGDWPRIAGDWPQADGYARSLARHMERSAHRPEIRKLLCL
jgi:hypothetical protein